MKKLGRDIWRGLSHLGLRESFGTIADLLAVAMVALEIYRPHMKPDTADNLMIRFFCWIFVLNIILLYVSEIRWHMKARHAEAQSFIHEAYHKCRDAWYKILTTQTEQLNWLRQRQERTANLPFPVSSNEDIHMLLKEATVHMASAISLISGVKCRVYVRELVCVNPAANPVERGFVTTNFFASETMPQPADGQHFITDDYHIMELWSHPENRCFFSGNVAKIPGFRLSDCPAGKEFDTKSIASWPIRKYRASGTPDVVGYLCFDSQAREAFTHRYDFAVGAAFADTLYPLLSGWRAAKNASNGAVV